MERNAVWVETRRETKDEAVPDAPVRLMALAVWVCRAVKRTRCAVAVGIARAFGAIGTMRREAEGQGTTEYAILVGVLVVIAIAAILLFRGSVQDLWDSIQTSINQLSS